MQGRVPEHVRDQVRIEVNVVERYVAIVESRPAVAGGVWALSGLRFRSPGCVTRGLRGCGHCIGATATCVFTSTTGCLQPRACVEDLLAGVDSDLTAIFGVDAAGGVVARLLCDH
jgi:hypothetical protein